METIEKYELKCNGISTLQNHLNADLGSDKDAYVAQSFSFFFHK